MRTFISFFITLCLNGYSQITKVNIGNITSNLVELSVIGKNVFVNDTWGYSVISKDGCNTINYLPLPESINQIRKVQRLDTNNLIMLSYDNLALKLYKSVNGGLNWTLELDTVKPSTFGHYWSKFFDLSNGIITRWSYFMWTNDSCKTWNPGTMTLSGSDPANMRLIKTYGDSMVCIGTGNTWAGGFSLSKNRGNTWTSSYVFMNSMKNYGNVPADFYFLNKDTIFGVSSNGEMTKTFNSGSSWTNSVIPLTNCGGIFFKNAYEGYFLGSDSLGWGVVLKTTDLGQTWWRYNIGLSTTILNMALLDDSTALLSGTNGMLLKWKYKESNFVGIKENEKELSHILVFPNPTTDRCNITIDKTFNKNVQIIVYNQLGQELLNQTSPITEEKTVVPLNTSQFPNGIYLVTISDETKRVNKKLIIYRK